MKPKIEMIGPEKMVGKSRYAYHLIDHGVENMDEWQQLVSETKRISDELQQFAELVAKLAVDVSIIEGIEEAKRGEDVNNG